MNITEISKNRLKYELPDFEHKDTWIAGGAVRDALFGDQFSDIDVFGKDKEALQAFINNNLTDCKLLYNSEKVKTYLKDGNKVQVIFRHTYDSMDKCIGEFDFTASQFAMDSDKIIGNSDALLDVARKAIVVHKVHKDFAVDTLRRMQKYIKKGYTICNGGLKTIALTLSDLSEKDVEEQFEYYPDGSPQVIRFD